MCTIFVCIIVIMCVYHLDVDSSSHVRNYSLSLSLAFDVLDAPYPS